MIIFSTTMMPMYRAHWCAHACIDGGQPRKCFSTISLKHFILLLLCMLCPIHIIFIQSPDIFRDGCPSHTSSSHVHKLMDILFFHCPSFTVIFTCNIYTPHTSCIQVSLSSNSRDSIDISKGKSSPNFCQPLSTLATELPPTPPLGQIMKTIHSEAFSSRPMH